MSIYKQFQRLMDVFHSVLFILYRDAQCYETLISLLSRTTKLVHREEYEEINISGIPVCFKYVGTIVRVTPVLDFG